MKLLLVGASGRLGAALRDHFPQALCPARSEFDFENSNQILEYLETHQPEIVINAVGFTDVEKAESERARAYQVNTETPLFIATWCSQRRIPFVTFSSDYVFDGDSARPLNENDPTRPVNFYGYTKSELESRLRLLDGPSLVIRSSWLYGGKRDDFVSRMLTLLAEKEELQGVSDEISAPTYCGDLASAVAQAVDRWLKKRPSGFCLYHLAASSSASRYEWILEIRNLALESGRSLKASKVHPILLKDWVSPVARPAYSFLDCGKIREELGIQLPDWKTSLRGYWTREFSRAPHSRLKTD